MNGRHGRAIALAGAAILCTDAAALAAPAGKCTSIQARCAVEIGGMCNPKTGYWQYGYVRGYATGGTPEAYDACISRALANPKSAAAVRMPPPASTAARTATPVSIASSAPPSSSTAAGPADCRTMSFNFHPEQNDSISTTGVSTGGGACTHRYHSNSTMQMISSAIVSRPRNGTLSEIGAFQFRYAPNRGFKGLERYAVRICARGGGCSTINYAITVE